MPKDNLSDDARVISTSLFRFGAKASIKVGGQGAKSKLTERAKNALAELIKEGYVTANPFNEVGRMEYQGTDKLAEALENKSIKYMSQKDMETKGKWSLTQPNL